MLSAQDWRFALRGLRKDRGFTFLAVVLLALGIGLTSAVFTLLWQAIYARLPVPHPEQIAAFQTNVTHNGRSDSDAGTLTFSLPTYRYLAGHFTAVKGLVARHGEMVNIETPNGPRHLRANFVTGNFFDVLEVKPVVGRAIAGPNDAPSDDRFVAMLSYDFWQQQYGGELSAWNSRVRVNGVRFRVIGIAPPGFHDVIAGQAPQVFLPVASYGDLNPGWKNEKDWSVRWLNPFARLREGVSRSAAEAQLQPVYRAAVRAELAGAPAQPAEYLQELSHEHLSLVPAAQGDHGMFDNWSLPLRILQWMTLSILALAVLNVAGLMLVRAVSQRREMLVRYALGASRTEVMRLQFLQTLLLALAGGLAGLWIARWGALLLAHLAGMDRDSTLDYQPHGLPLAVHWAAAVTGGFLAGLLPAWQNARINLAAGLNEGALTHSAGRAQATIRRGLAAAQIALSLVLAISAGWFATTLQSLVSVPVGFKADHVSVFSIDPKLSHANLPGAQLLWSNIERRLKQTAGVLAVTYGTGGPFPQAMDVAVVIPGTNSEAIKQHQSATRDVIGPRYFSTLGMHLIAGREFDDRDRRNTPGVIMMTQALARKLYGSANPLGRTVTMFNGLEPNWQATVVGLVADYHQSWKRAGPPIVYTPAQQAQSISEMTYYVRTSANALPEATIRSILQEDAPGLAAYDVATMESRMAGFAAGERSMALLTAVFGLLSLAIAAVGIYGVVAYGASLRITEFGVRVAVGAQPGDIRWLVLREALLILAAGLILATPLTIGALSLAGHQLVSGVAHQAGIYLGAVLLLAVCTLSAALHPARRATRISTLSALRHG